MRGQQNSQKIKRVNYVNISKASKSYKREGDGKHENQFFLDNSAMKTFLAIALLSLALNLVSGSEVSSDSNYIVMLKL